MNILTNRLIPVLAVFCIVLSGKFVNAQDVDPIEDLLAQLSDPATEDWERVEGRVMDAWSRSGSVAMDLLLQRGQDALEAENYQVAIEHFTALTDHSPGFAEAWNMRATAFFLIDEFGLSVEDIGRTLALNPKHFGALSGLGVILEQIGDTGNALLAYRAAYEINPHRENLTEAISRLENEVDGTSI